MDMDSLLSCLLLLGEWKIAIIEPGDVVDAETRKEVMALYERATTVNSASYMAWHQWGLSNYRAIEEAKARAEEDLMLSTMEGNGAGKVSKSPAKRGRSFTGLGNISLSPDILAPLAANATAGLMRALTLGRRSLSSSVTQDMLCILSIWFRYGKMTKVCEAIETGLRSVHVDTWLGVLPQLIARIDHPEKNARELLHMLLTRLGERHAQALVYPLSVALMSPTEERKDAATTLMNSLKRHSRTLIEQALMVADELRRVTILWQERWHEVIEDASRLYFGEGNVRGMIDMLVMLHTRLEDGPDTMREASFVNTYGQELQMARDALRRYVHSMQSRNLPIPESGGVRVRGAGGASGEEKDPNLKKAWEIYYQVFTRINRQLPNVTTLDLNYCSPALVSARDLELGVPGTYNVNGTTVRIHSFDKTVGIIRSKQRPRKIRILGQGGQEFVFLLKGHEDLRQDERAMQLFGLVNALLQHDSRTGGESHDVSIQRYAVVPLSPSAGRKNVYVGAQKLFNTL
jgi:FKBP12-rapamycin complex-associated protein